MVTFIRYAQNVITSTSAGGLLVTGGIILTVVSDSTPTWLLDIFIIENYSS
jgi:hypothetical protein